MVDVSDDSLYTTWIGTDALCEGRKAAEWLNGFAEAKGIAASDIHIADIQGTIGSTAQIGRTKGLEEGVDKYGWVLWLSRQVNLHRLKVRKLWSLC